MLDFIASKKRGTVNIMMSRILIAQIKENPACNMQAGFVKFNSLGFG
jgi:hypothetical protein